MISLVDALMCCNLAEQRYGDHGKTLGMGSDVLLYNITLCGV